MRDLGAELVQAALSKGLISSNEQERVQTLVDRSGGKAYAAQIMVRERMISCSDLLTLQNNLSALLYECPTCEKRFPRDSLPSKPGKTFRCKGCKKKVVLDEPVLSRLEVLTSRDPLDLTITLGEVETSISSEVSEIDLNRYEVGEELGRGGYGVVFKAYHKDLERDVALKVLRPSKDLPRITLERFIREGRSASRLKHPNVVGVYDIGRSRDLYALAMEYVPGKSLKAHIKERKRIPWAEAVEMMDQILAGVAHAHDNGIIHRDLKPTNIIIEEGTGRPRIIDFGLAKDLESDVHLTAAGAIVGTPYYLSPEQIEGRSRKVDARSDIFALGVILYFMIAGKRPFDSKLKTEIYHQILKDDPQPLGEIVADVPGALQEVLDTAMAKHRKDRFASVPDLRAALEEVLVAPSSKGKSKGKVKTRSKSKSKRTKVRDSKRSRRAGVPAQGAANAMPLKIAAGVGILIAVLGLGYGLGSGGPKTDGSEDDVVVTDGSTDQRETPRPTDDDPPTDPPADPDVTDPSDTADTPDTPDAPRDEPDEPDESDADPDPLGEPHPEDDAGEEPEFVSPVDPTPEPDAIPPVPEIVPVKALELDDGSGDAAEFPELAGRKKSEWLDRAFYLNAVADNVPSPRNLRALRLGLSDREPLNNGFALRGLNRYQDGPFLTAYGSEGLFAALVDLCSGQEPFVENTCQSLLVRMCGGQPRSKSAWKKYWREEGEQVFLDAALHPPDVVIPKGREKADTERVHTRTRKITEYFSKLRKGGLEILFVIDVTISMTKQLDRMHAQVTEITSFMDLLLPHKVRMGFVTYGDDVVNTLPLTKRLNIFAREVEKIEIFNDLSDLTIEEGISKGLGEALTKKIGWKNKAQRTILLLGDAPPLDYDLCVDLAKQAGEKGFIINGLIVKPPQKYANKPPHAAFEEMAKAASGLTVELDSPEELITRILVFAFGSSQEADLRRFVSAYREVTGSANQGSK